MGISVDVGGFKQDSSYLFQSLSSGNGGTANLNFLSDYASLKNGSYAKLMKAYYATDQDSGTTAGSTKSSSKNILKKLEEEKKNPRVSKDVQTANSNLTAGLSSMKSSLAALQGSGTYTDSENGKSAADKVVSAVKTFVSDYNNVVNAAKGSTLTGKTAYVANMMSSTSANSGKLSEIGVRVNTNGTLEIDEAKLKAADISKVQDLFTSDDIMSYGSRLASRVQFAGAAAGTSAADSTTATETNKAASNAAGLKADGKTLASDELYQKVKDKEGTEKYDVDKIFAAAKSFVNNYNGMFDTAESSANSGVLANLSSIREKTAKNADVLKQFGISVDEKGKMTIDEETFKKADMSKVQEFFKDYGSSVSTNASLVDYYMTTQANAGSGYTAAGAYNVQGSSGYTDTM
ncbi:MAG: flagellar filament capping protein FliD [Butyrivibrio sp.]|nr:flagellar filament capping protein FliD [Acetatifactor muris]MCM1560064.1 flagellar filament capping protein FliD [Butyrivibrio sp.]